MTQPPFGDIPLFRELQKLLSSSEGPINYEIARQVAGAVAAQAGSEPPVTPEVSRAYAEAVRSAEVLTSGYTRLPLDEPMKCEVVTRSWWVTATLDGWKWLLNRLAERFGGELGRMGGRMGGEEAAEHEEGVNSMQQAMGQIGPLLLGLQTGQLAGQLATESVARYYYPIPRDDSGGLFFVLANITRVANDYGFEESSFRSWLAAQEVSRHLVMASVSWSGRYFRNLLETLVDSIEIDIADLERRLMELQSSGFEALQEGPPDAIPVVQTERHSRALGRVRAFLALLEGYGTHAANSVLPQLVGDASAKIGEGMARLRASPSDGQTMLASLLGISFDRALETSGATFCAAVVKLRGLADLNRVWDAPDNLPSSDEIKDPFAWMERVLDK